jgi:uncharacterized protein YkwD
MLNVRSRFVVIVLVLLCSGTFMFVDALFKSARAVTLCSLTAGLIGCSSDTYKPSGQPTFYKSMAAPDAQVDAKAAASMISGYRRNNGLGLVSLDPALMRMAEEQARAMASKNRFEHDAAGPFAQRIKRGYDAKVAVENIGAGYHTLAEAFSGWRDSPPHRANMLRDGVTKMGIAAAYAPNTKYKVFWSLILAAPDDHRG